MIGNDMRDLVSAILAAIREAVFFGGSGVHPGLAVIPIILAVGILAPLGWLIGRLLDGFALIAAAAGAALAVSVVASIARPGLRSGTADPASLSRCVLTEPFTSTLDTRLNLLLLMPFAVLAVLAIGRPLLVTTVAMGASASIETVQALYRVGACDSSDLVHNTVGALLVAVVVAVVRTVGFAIGNRIGVTRDARVGSGS